MSTVKKLNAALYSSFAVFEGPSRAYFELPIEYVFQGVKSVQPVRVAYYTLSLKGAEEDCCEEVLSILQSSVPLEILEDATAALFIRTWFEYDKTESKLFGRLAFWKPEYNTNLICSRALKPEGMEARAASRREEK